MRWVTAAQLVSLHEPDDGEDANTLGGGGEPEPERGGGGGGGVGGAGSHPAGSRFKIDALAVNGGVSREGTRAVVPILTIDGRRTGMAKTQKRPAPASVTTMWLTPCTASCAVQSESTWRHATA
eukprot:COSAG01_NODE_40386_length_464_cov_1.101370_1_plen_123_part_01